MKQDKRPKSVDAVKSEKVASRIALRSVEDLAIAETLVGLPVGPRRSRTKEKKEWYVLLNVLRYAVPMGAMELPTDIRCGNPSATPTEPDFVASRPGTDEVIALFEITEATTEVDQREMTLFERSGKTALLGEFGGRFSNGASHPEISWASDIFDAVTRKHRKTIFKPSPVRRHLLVYPNSNASMLMFNEKDERRGIELLREQFADDDAFPEIANGCSVHILGKYIVCLDALADQAVIVGKMEALSRKAQGLASVENTSQLIDAKIEQLGGWRGEMLARLRAVIKAADPEIVETVKWQKPSNPAGVPVWEHDGIVCTGETYKDKVKLTFDKGAALPDPKGLFNSSLDGNRRRAIDIFEGDEVDEKALTALVRTAVALNGKKKAK